MKTREREKREKGAGKGGEGGGGGCISCLSLDNIPSFFCSGLARCDYFVSFAGEWNVSDTVYPVFLPACVEDSDVSERSFCTFN